MLANFNNSFTVQTRNYTFMNIKYNPIASVGFDIIDIAFIYSGEMKLCWRARTQLTQITIKNYLKNNMQI